MLQLLSALKNRQLDVIAGIHSKSALVEALEEKGIPWIDTSIHSVSYNLNSGPRYYIGLLKGFFKLIKFLHFDNISMIYANTFITALLGVIAGRIRGIPVIFYDHDINSHRFFSKIVTRFCHHILAVSKAAAAKYSNKENKKLTIIYNGIDTAKFTPGKSKLGSQLFGKKPSLVVGYAGRISAIKGVNLIPALAKIVIEKVPAAKFWIVGDPFLKQDEGLLDLLETEMIQLGLKDHIVFSGFQKDIIDVIRGFDILIFPPKKDTFPTILLEAMAVEKPVVSTNWSGAEEIIQDGETGFLVPVGNSQAMAEKIINLLENEEIRHLMGQKARKYVINKFSMNQQIDNFLLIHNSISRPDFSKQSLAAEK
ncbi:MAG: hypothetical protein A2161_01190 [Candidatus Schekmanbacteria bacterium RBG_13_48_7]|uniref:Glycosyl transferase family 1 domain-containing protein n=1 Tax=Candidatus Schekmanbacteria bacterium RBG_13_48_7 TaxID=1817878 RepID=A0A1F7RND6_9BACT|nr:MAG: hypothetical protein A2161_01190 [Candidatus Schekmanbacteria bacterium RBG_13_48_7]